MEKRADVDQIRINIFEVDGDNLHIEGCYYLPACEDEYSLEAYCDGTVIPAELHDVNQRDIVEDGELLYHGRIFGMDIPLKKGKRYRFRLLDSKGEPLKGIAVGYGVKGKLTKLTEGSYYASGKYLIRRMPGGFSIAENTFKGRVKAELRFLRGLKKKRILHAIIYRMPAKIWRRHKKRPVWIFSDRTTVAGDNAEALFRYVTSLPESKKYRLYFLLEKDSPDLARMKKIGKVVHPGSYKYKLAFLCADWIVSSHADKWTIDAFGKEMFLFKDMYTYKYAFLQHGITKDDVSRWLWKQNRFISLFVTAGKREYESILTGNYDYDENVVRLTGFPRFDRLENDAKKLVFFLPTWRRGLATELIEGSSERPYSEEFKNTDYCKFYNRLINDERILAAMKENGYKGEFYVHPAASNQAVDFKGNDIIEAKNEPADYRRIFREGNLIVTDFSSVAFDFAYLKKPIVYSQFDKETFFEGHLYKQGYFSYDDDGFGPVCVAYDDIADTIIGYINNGCVMEDKYKKRVDDFFEFTDKDNCRRVYEDICRLS